MKSLETYCAICGANNGAETEKCFACGNSLKVTSPLPEETSSSAAILAASQPQTETLLHGRYRILHKIGEGGFSSVFKAEDQQRQRVVAIKAIALQGLSTQEKIDATDAFNREVNMLTKLDHRNLPRLYDHFADAESWYMVMDFIEGTTLERRMERRKDTPLPLEEVLDIALVLCNVLEYLHSLSTPIIFRDLKPANIIQTRSGHLFLIDFGIARHFRPGQLKDTIPFGSPGYAAPEQYGRAQTTPRSDIYSLGAILHFLLTGLDPAQNPFHFEDIQLQPQTIYQPLDKLIQSMVALNVQERPDTHMVKRELQTLSTHRSSYQRGYQAPYISPMYAPTTQRYQPPPSMPTGGQGYTVGQVMAYQTQTGTPMYTPRTYANNRAAMWSILFLILSLLMPIIAVFMLFLLATHNIPTYAGFSALLICLPPILTIKFGHAGRHYAQQMGMSTDVATVSMVFGYILLGIYSIGLLCLIPTLLFALIL